MGEFISIGGRTVAAKWAILNHTVELSTQYSHANQSIPYLAEEESSIWSKGDLQACLADRKSNKATIARPPPSDVISAQENAHTNTIRRHQDISTRSKEKGDPGLENLPEILRKAMNGRLDLHSTADYAQSAVNLHALRVPRLIVANLADCLMRHAYVEKASN